MSGGEPSYTAARWVFLRLLALTYGIAFASLTVQVRGLVGTDGILPAGAYLDAAHASLGPAAYAQLPTLLWLGSGDAVLLGLCVAGLAGSLLLLFEFAEPLLLPGLWAAYLSLTVAGQTFLSFQWDALLLECGLVALFWTPLRWSPGRLGGAPAAIGRWLAWGLLFRLMFLSGITKLLSDDPTWVGLTALTFHYETQPLPTALSWHAHQLPAGFHRLSAAAMFGVELGAPWLLFVPARGRGVALRRLAAGSLAAFQILIAATGNYGFFNLLTLALALSTLDGAAWRRLLPAPAFAWMERSGPEGPRRRAWPQQVSATAALGLAALQLLAFAAEIQHTRGRPLPRAAEEILAAVAPLRSINGYGLFRVMTTRRPEIVLEASEDGRSWREIPFRWKPGDPASRPDFVAPHMPRLDWQLWFAALDPRRAEPWLARFLARLLDGSPAVLDLLGDGAFAAAPPRYLRLVLYDYRFTTRAERRASGRWWERSARRELTRPLSRADRAGVP